jgi:hypothetical protein
MADLSHNSSVGIVVETVSGTFSAPNPASDLLQAADLKVAINGLTVAVNEYTGSIHKPGPAVIGRTIDVTMKIYVRGPGGTATPTAGALVLGRILRASSFTEVVQSAAIPVAPEALAAGTTTQITLGTTAAATQDLYKGLAVSLAGLGATMPKNLTMIRSYSAAKVALLAETAAAALGVTNYQIPKQIAYQLSPSSVVPTLSLSVWQGTRRYDCTAMAVSSFKLNLPTASRSNSVLPSIDVTLSGSLVADYDDVAPVITAGLAIPPFNNGKLWVSGVSVGGASMEVNFNAGVAYPPDPNRTDGNAPAQMASTSRTVALTLNQYTKATIDFGAIALGQLNQPIMAMYGSGTGNFFGVIITDARFNYRSPDATGEFITSTGDAYVDGANRDVSFVLPFFP